MAGADQSAGTCESVSHTFLHTIQYGIDTLIRQHEMDTLILLMCLLNMSQLQIKYLCTVIFVQTFNLLRKVDLLLQMFCC